ncbi:hypothetical protein K470DRAFT_243553 [Piedraia hortae CBS 480.64]|uniref:DNA/RNA-binding domain-containing protein n=1 Tax=Piedraia hortae CBS 480.64 TaxID=1314780 RepID=A0A6A7C4N4_9PEZI|nr:hypothetical protein K470DRAFT_243553 [Piedraia hortae CBS 480.64]
MPSYPPNPSKDQLASHTNVHALTKPPPNSQQKEPRNLPTRDASTKPLDPPATKSITHVQLTNEIAKIFNGLEAIEKKCIEVDGQISQFEAISLEKWQEMFALHRSLLNLHHDFLMATYHPTGTPEIKKLVVERDMPARLWRHGIHTPLELLRVRRPATQEHMITYISLAYGIMTLLCETRDEFLDIWIECLGDLSRYRMAIETEAETQAMWTNIARYWYEKAAYHQPQVGRLCHHLGILERVSLRKFAWYGRSLISVKPFASSRESMKNLCISVSAHVQRSEVTSQMAEPSLCHMQALLFLQKSDDEYQQAFGKLSSLLIPEPGKASTLRWNDCGMALAITNICTLLDFGSLDNPFMQIYNGYPCSPRSEGRRSAQAVFCTSFEAALMKTNGERFRATLSYLHTTLSFIHSGIVATKSLDYKHSLPLQFEALCWGKLAEYLNELKKQEPEFLNLKNRVCNKEFFPPDNTTGALPDDVEIRGLIWATKIYPSDFFPEKEEEYLTKLSEDKYLPKRRQRVLHWGLCLVRDTGFLTYDGEMFGTLSGCQSMVLTPSISKDTDVEMTDAPPAENRDSHLFFRQRQNTFGQGQRRQMEPAARLEESTPRLQPQPFSPKSRPRKPAPQEPSVLVLDDSTW